MAKKTNTILTVRWSMDDLYEAFAEAGIPSTDENIKKVLSEETLERMRESAAKHGWEILHEQIAQLSADGEEPEAGFREFCEVGWTYTWSGKATWYADHVHVDIEGEGTAEWKLAAEELLRKHLGVKLLRNPYMSADSIFKLISDKLDEMLDAEYKEYAEGDGYYPPVGEDFEFDYHMKKFLEKCGLELTSCDYDGSTSDYEENFDRHHYW